MNGSIGVETERLLNSCVCEGGLTQIKTKERNAQTDRCEKVA